MKEIQLSEQLVLSPAQQIRIGSSEQIRYVSTNRIKNNVSRLTKGLDNVHAPATISILEHPLNAMLIGWRFCIDLRVSTIMDLLNNVAACPSIPGFNCKTRASADSKANITYRRNWRYDYMTSAACSRAVLLWHLCILASRRGLHWARSTIKPPTYGASSGGGSSSLYHWIYEDD